MLRQAGRLRRSWRGNVRVLRSAFSWMYILTYCSRATSLVRRPNGRSSAAPIDSKPPAAGWGTGQGACFESGRC